MAAPLKLDPFTGFSRRNVRLFLLIVALGLFLASTIIAWRQEPRPYPLKLVTTLSLDWWRYPRE